MSILNENLNADNNRINQSAVTVPGARIIKEGLDLLCAPGEVYELLVANSQSGSIGGFYNDREMMAEQALFLTGGCKVQTNFGDRFVPAVPTVYYTINPVNPDKIHLIGNKVRTIKSEKVKNGKVIVPGEAAEDRDIVRRHSILIDCDPKRMAGISANNVEHERALDKARQIREDLDSLGFPEGCLADSGNGGHIRYIVDLPNDEPTKGIIKRFCESLSAKYSDEFVDVDTGVFNAARLCTVYGTWKRKGEETTERPHRLSKILDSPRVLEPVPVQLLLSITGSSAEAEKSAGINMDKMRAERDRLAGKKQVDEEAWYLQYRGNLRTLDIPSLFECKGLEARDKGDRFEVTCPWGESSHTDGSTGGAVIWGGDGVFPNFHCRHQHCKDRTIEQVCEWFGKEAIDAHCSDHFLPKEKLRQKTTGEKGEKKEKKESLSGCLVRMFHETGSSLVRAEDGMLFARIYVDDHLETISINGKAQGFKDWLSGQWYERTGDPVKAEPLKEALSVFQYHARKEPKQTVHLRWAYLPDRIYLDLGNDRWDAIEITRDGWKVVRNPQVIFRRSANTAAFPYPNQKGNLDRLREFFTGDLDSYLLFKGSVLAAVGNWSYFVTCFHGEAGSAKSTACRQARRLVDPVGAVEITRLPKVIDSDTVKGISHMRAVCYDNVSYISPETADFLCTLSTGGGLPARLLYSDDDMKYYDYKRPVWMNGIPDFVDRSDLADRSITIQLPVIEKKEDETSLDERWNEAMPEMLGGLLDCIANGLRNLRSTQVCKEFRMGAAVRWVNACNGNEEFTRVYKINREHSGMNALMSSNVANLLTEFVRSPKIVGGCAGNWRGSATDLREKILACASRREATVPKKFPERSNTFASELRRDAPLLRNQSGIEVRWTTVKGAAVITVSDTRLTTEEPESEPGTETSTVTVAAATTIPLPEMKEETEVDNETVVYRFGDRVKVAGLVDAMQIVTATSYGGNAQFFQVEHPERDWKPPKGFSVNTNTGKIRVCVELRQIEGLAS